MQEYQRLEKEYARYVGTDFAISTNTGTSALHLALKAIGIKKGDEVIIPEFTMIACAFAVSYCGATPVFVDCGDDLLIDVKKIKRKITKRTKAIMPVHIYGRICDMTTIMKLADKYKLRVIEDCCEAQGAKYKGKTVGSFDIGVFSFFANKIISAEEGGMITTNDEKIKDKANFLKNMSFTEDHDYLHPEIGFNYRMSNAQAKIARINLYNVDNLQKKRFLIEKWYNKYLDKKLQLSKREVVWVYDIQHSKKDEIIKILNKEGINARYSFKPMSQQPPYLGRYKHLKAYKKSKEICYLPVNPSMDRKLVQKICMKVNNIVK